MCMGPTILNLGLAYEGLAWPTHPNKTINKVDF